MSLFDFLWRKPQPKPSHPSTSAVRDGCAQTLPTMLILRGIAGHFAGRDWPRGALDEASALEYARARGYRGEVLDVSGATGAQSAQTRKALAALRSDSTIAALYGFSGGGYNIRHVIAALSAAERARLALVVVLGAPNNPPSLYKGPWELVYRNDPPGGHMAGPRALLAETTADAGAGLKPAPILAGLKLRYLIGADDPGAGRAGEVIEVGYDARVPPPSGIAVKYCNLFDEHDTGRYGPYLPPSGTAAQYGEGRIDPRGSGWERNLTEQFARARAQGFRIVELDNPDAYAVADVLGAVDRAARHGLAVIAKNPLLIDGDPVPYLAHPAIVGVIVERGAGNPADMHDLRMKAGKPDLPVWFVAYGAGRAWAAATARAAAAFREMRVSYSARGEYASSEDVTV